MRRSIGRVGLSVLAVLCMVATSVAQLPKGVWFQPNVLYGLTSISSETETLSITDEQEQTTTEYHFEVKRAKQVGNEVHCLLKRNPRAESKGNNTISALKGYTYLRIRLQAQQAIAVPGNSILLTYQSKRKAKKALKADTLTRYFFPCYLPLTMAQHRDLPPIDSMSRDTVRAFLNTLLAFQAAAPQPPAGELNVSPRKIQADVEYRALVATGFNPRFSTGKLWAMIPSKFASDDEIMRLMAKYFGP